LTSSTSQRAAARLAARLPSVNRFLQGYSCIFSPETTTDANHADRHADSAETALAAGTPLQSDPNFRSEIHNAEDTIDVETYGGGFDLTRRATAPRLRVGRDKWFNLLWLIPIGFGLLVAAIAIGKGLYNTPAVKDFVDRYPGADSSGITAGLARVDALFQPVHDDVHHQDGDPNSL
jgi:hypothetical protein